MEPVAVMHLVPSLDRGGRERFLLDLLSRLDPDLFAVTVGITGPTVQSDVRAAFAAAGIRSVHFGARGERLGTDAGLRARLRALRGLRDHLHVLQPRIVHTHGTLNNIYGVLAARWAGVPHIMTQDHEGVPPERASRLALRWTARAADVSFVPRAAAAATRRALAGACSTRVLSLPVGVDLQRYAPAPRAARAAARAALGLAPDAFVLGAVGCLLERKRLDVLLDALPDVCGRAPETRVLVVGDGPARAALENRAQALGIAAHVVFTGWLANVEAAYSALDIFVSAGEASPMTGRTLAEALACGLVALVRSGPYGDEIADQAAVRCQTEGRAFVEQILALARAPQERARIGARARAHAVQSLDVAPRARLLESVYAHVVARTQRPWNETRIEAQPDPGSLGTGTW